MSHAMYYSTSIIYQFMIYISLCFPFFYMILEQFISGRRGRQDLPEEITEDNADMFDAEVVEDDASTPSVDGFGDVCEAVMFNKDGETISFQFLKNKCE